MQFIDRKFLSINSTLDVAAALPAGILCFTLFSFFSVTTGFSAAIVSQYNGRDNHKACSRVPWSAFYYALAAGMICSYIMPYIGSYIINIGGHLPEIIIKEKQYFNVMIPAGGFTCVMIAFCSFSRVLVLCDFYCSENYIRENQKKLRLNSYQQLLFYLYSV